MTANYPDHDRLRESAGLYALNALEPADRAEFEEHLRSCAECTAEVRSLRAAATALPHAVPLVEPPPALRQRVMAIAGGETSGATVIAMPPPSRAARSTFSAGWLSAAALLLVSIGLGGYSLSLRDQIAGLQSEVSDLTTRLERSEQQVTVATRLVSLAESRMAVLTAPDMTQVDLQGQQPVAPRAAGRAFWSRSRGLVFTASDLPPLPAGRSYQLWIVTASAPVSAGLLQIDSAGRVAQSFNPPEVVGPAAAIAVTQEVEGGVPAPVGDKYLVGVTH